MRFHQAVRFRCNQITFCELSTGQGRHERDLRDADRGKVAQRADEDEEEPAPPQAELRVARTHSIMTLRDPLVHFLLHVDAEVGDHGGDHADDGADEVGAVGPGGAALGVVGGHSG